MKRVKGVKEKLHLPIYDAFFVPGGRTGAQAATFEEMMTDPRVIRFFADVQNKTKLETNLQAAGVLPRRTTFEVRAMRVVISSPVEGQPLQSPPQVGEPSFLTELVYNSVTTLLVGERIMMEMPTFWYSTGGGFTGQFAASSLVSNRGEADQVTAFRLGEPVIIEPQQNFRVEMLFPRDVPDSIKRAIGPLHVWVVLDGYLTRISSNR